MKGKWPFRIGDWADNGQIGFRIEKIIADYYCRTVSRLLVVALGIEIQLDNISLLHHISFPFCVMPND